MFSFNQDGRWADDDDSTEDGWVTFSYVQLPNDGGRAAIQKKDGMTRTKRVGR
jgi:hypothetical protein